MSFSDGGLSPSASIRRAVMTTRARNAIVPVLQGRAPDEAALRQDEGPEIGAVAGGTEALDAGELLLDGEHGLSPLGAGCGGEEAASVNKIFRNGCVSARCSSGRE
jgi:hypothetical protein